MARRLEAAAPIIVVSGFAEPAASANQSLQSLRDWLQILLRLALLQLLRNEVER